MSRSTSGRPLDVRPRVRDCVRRLKLGNQDSYKAWNELANLLLAVTVAGKNEVLRLRASTTHDRAMDLDRMGGGPIALRDGRYLDVRQTLAVTDEGDGKGPLLRVISSNYQFQRDREGEEWLFRFDYLRTPDQPHPGAHVQVRAQPFEDGWMPSKKPLAKMHFPTRRVPLESILRLLIEDFNLKPAVPASIWRPALAESEALFKAIAHEPSPGPAQ